MLTVILAPGSLNHTANIIKGFAIAIGIGIAIGFVWMWWVARQRERRQELESRARAAWTDWLRVALANPEMSQPSAAAFANPIDVVRYRSFVESLLATADHILLLDPSETWRDAIRRHLQPHRSWLASPEFQTTALRHCSPALTVLVAETVGAGNPRAARGAAHQGAPPPAATAAANPA